MFPDELDSAGDSLVRQVELETTGVQQTVRDTVCYASALIVVVAGIAGVLTLEPSSAMSLGWWAVAVALAGVALVSHRRQPLPWVSLAALACTAVAVLSNPSAGIRADGSTIIIALTYFGVVLLPQRRGLVAVAAGAVALVCAVLWLELRTDTSTVTSATRWILVAQLVVSALWLWWVWDAELEDVRRRDRQMVELERDRLNAIRLRERVRIARDTLVHTHETVLNDLRYTITTPEPDRQRLGEQLALRRAAIALLPQRPTVASTVAAVVESEGLGRAITVSGPDADLEQRHADALASVLVEVIRNAQRYAAAQSFSVVSATSDDMLSVAIRHDGATNDDSASPGIGRSIVIEESLVAIGGSARPALRGFDLVLPVGGSNLHADDRHVPDIARATLSVVTAGNAVGGVPHLVLLASTSASAYSLLATALALLAIAVGAHATLRRRIGVVGGLVLAATGAAVPLLLSRMDLGCDDADVAVIVSTLTGYALCSAAVWTPNRRWWWAGTGWIASVAVLYDSLPQSCSGTTAASIRAAALPVGCLIFVFWSQNHAVQRGRDAQLVRRQQASEVAAAVAALDISRQLNDTVAEATDLMTTVAEGADLDDTLRTRLRCLDAAIRAAIQSDPVTSGGLTQAARSLVSAAVDVNIPVRVLTLRDSGDLQPVSPAIMQALVALVTASIEGTAVVQVLSTPGQDVLLLTTSSAAATRSGLDRNWTSNDGSDTAELEWSDDSPVVVAVVTRKSTRESGGNRTPEQR